MLIGDYNSIRMDCMSSSVCYVLKYRKCLHQTLSMNMTVNICQSDYWASVDHQLKIITSIAITGDMKMKLTSLDIFCKFWLVLLCGRNAFVVVQIFAWVNIAYNVNWKLHSTVTVAWQTIFIVKMPNVNLKWWIYMIKKSKNSTTLFLLIYSFPSLNKKLPGFLELW